MSRSSLWVMNKDFYGEEIQEYDNSWLFSPIIWDVLLEKHMPERRMKLFDGTRGGFMSSVIADKTLNRDLNNKINNCGIMYDRVLWEMSNQQIFFTKDKLIIANSITSFLNENKEFDKGTFPLKQKHIIERFNEIAEGIKNLDEKQYPYFIFKNTSVDDNVEYWFSKYDESEDEYVSSPLNKVDKIVTEFVYIDNDKIADFKTNIDYFELGKEEE